MSKTKYTTRWTTVCTLGYTGSISRDENRAAHGGVCHYQARCNRDGEIMGRKVNSNGRHQEVGEAFVVDADTLGEVIVQVLMDDVHCGTGRGKPNEWADFSRSMQSEVLSLLK